MQAQRSTAIKKWHIVLLAAILSILFVLGGYLYYRYQEEDIRRHNHRMLSSIGEMKANQLAYWYEDEIYDASVFSRNPLFARFIEEWLRSGSIADRTNLIDLLDVTADSHSYENILITDPHGELLLSFIPEIVAIDSIVVTTVRRAVNEREIISTDLYKSPIHQTIYIDFLTPVVNDQEETIAVLVLRMDPNEYVYPFIRSWPVPTETAEAYIFRKENDTVLFLNALRHKDDAELKLRLPLTQTDLPAVQAALGYEGIFSGKDYRGVDVLADVRSIPGTPWFIVAKIDKREIFSELYFRAGVIISFVLLLILFLGAGLAFIYSNRQRILYRELYNTERELWESQEEFKTTLYSIGDAVITTDTAGKIRNMNPTAEQLTGWREPDAQGNPLEDVFKIINEESRNTVENPVQKVLQEGQVVGLANHTILISKEGKEIPIADSGAPIRNEAGEIIGVVLVFRDQTAEREAANKLRESERRLSTLMSNLPGMAYRCRNDSQRTMEFVSDGCVDLTGYAPDELVDNRAISYADFIHPNDRDMVMDEVQQSLNSNRPFQITYRIKTAAGSEKWVWEQGRGVYSEDGGLIALEGFITDITERKFMEDKLILQASALEAAANAIVITNRDGVIEWVNAAFTHLTGYSPEEAVGENTRLLKSGVHDHTYYKELWDTVLAGNVWRGELTNRRKDGSLYTEEQTITPVKNEYGEITHYIAIKQDITGLKQAEEIRIRFAAILEATPDFVSFADLEGNVLFINDAGRKMLDIDKDEDVSNLRIPEAHPDWARSIVVDQGIPAAIQDGIWHGETALVNRSGSEIPVSQVIVAPRSETGVPEFIATIVRDITERKRAEDELRRSEEQFRLIAENIPDMIVVLDTEGKRIYNNPSYEFILGDATSLVGTDSFQEIHPDDREKIEHIFKETIKSGTGQHTEYRLVSKDGDVRIIESKGGVIHDEQGNVQQVVVVSRDVTGKRKLEQQLLRTQRMESIGLLAGGIAHDLNNVLAPIMLSLNIIKQRVTDNKTATLLKTVEASAQRGADLIKQVLLFSRGIEGELTPIQIRHIIDEIENVVKQTFPKSISLKIDVPKDLRHIPADATQIHQVLMNLCINARDAMPDGGVLTISAKNIVIDEQYAKMNIETKPGTYVQVNVSDTGTGISQEIIGKIFDPFFTTKEQGKGTGLGLSTVYSIIKGHGGFVNVYSEEGRGTIFKVYLPARETEEDAVMKEKHQAPSGNGELILVVDDEKAVRAITQTTLEANGYNVVTAADGLEAVALYKEQRQDIDLVLMDLTMPNMDGYAAIRAIKKIHPGARFIVMSGLAPDEILIQEDFVEFLHKPFTAESMLLTIYEMLTHR